MVSARDRSGGEDNDNIGYIIGFSLHIHTALTGLLTATLYLLTTSSAVHEFFFFFLRDKCYSFILFSMP